MALWVEQLSPPILPIWLKAPVAVEDEEEVAAAAAVTAAACCASKSAAVGCAAFSPKLP